MHLLRDETGSAFVTATIVAVVLALLGAVVVGVGLWFEHRRDLQVRADAAALAGGQLLSDCFNIGAVDSSGNPVTEQTVDANAEGWAKSYGGMSGGLSTQNGAPYNHPYGPSSSDLMSFQSDTNPSSGSPTPTRNLGDECFKDGDATNTDPSNVNLMLDVRMSQEGIPFVPPFLSFLATVHGWARAQLQQIESVTPDLPLVPPDVDPKHVAVTFVDTSTGAALSGCANAVFTCTYPLTDMGASNGLTAWGGSAQIPVPSNRNIGMRVSLGNVDGDCAGVNGYATTTTWYRCYDYDASGNGASNLGIINIRGYPTGGAGSTTAPILRDASAVTQSPCAGSSFFSIADGGSCDVGVTAVVDFGGSPDYTQAHVRATINGTTFPLTHTGGQNWASSASAVTLPLGGGPYPVTMGWCYGTCNSNGAWTAFQTAAGSSTVQRVFAGDDGSDPNSHSGPILAASVIDSGNNPAYTLPATSGGGTTTLTVAIGLSGGVHLADRTSCPNPGSGASYSCPTDPPVLLRAVSPAGGGGNSQTYAVDCGEKLPVGPGQNAKLYQMIRYGCANPFGINSADICPDPANPTPPDCAPVWTGGTVGQVTKAMDARFAPNGVCDPNNYPVTDSNDPRVVTLLVTDFTGFSGSGGAGAPIPITHVASFYVTGWDPENNNFTACQGINGPPPAGYNPNGQSASIWGHFIKYYTLRGKPSGHVCQPSELEPCALGLVR